MEGVRTFWSWLRQVSGDAAYETYLRSQQRMMWHSTAVGPGEPRHTGAARGCCAGHKAQQPRLLSREEFYLDSLRRRYSGFSRCC